MSKWLITTTLLTLMVTSYCQVVYDQSQGLPGYDDTSGYRGKRAVNESLADEIKRIWSLNLEGFSLDPNKWDLAMQTRMTIVAAIAVTSAYLSYKTMYVVAIAGFVYGLTKLSWPLGACIMAIIYGWKMNNKVFLGIGLLLAYALCFGVKF